MDNTLWAVSKVITAYEQLFFWWQYSFTISIHVSELYLLKQENLIAYFGLVIKNVFPLLDFKSVLLILEKTTFLFGFLNILLFFMKNYKNKWWKMFQCKRPQEIFSRSVNIQMRQSHGVFCVIFKSKSLFELYERILYKIWRILITKHLLWITY